MRLSRARFEALVVRALDTIPEPIRIRMENIGVVIEEWPTEHQHAALGLDSGDLLFGLYEGTPLVEREITGHPLLPDKITIFRGPLEAAYQTEDEIAEEIRKTVIHEIAHHFGLDEQRLEDLGYG